MAKARKLGIKTGFTPNSQADRLRSDKAYRRGRKAERKYQQNAAAKSDLAKVIAAIDAAFASMPTHISTPNVLPEGQLPLSSEVTALFLSNNQNSPSTTQIIDCLNA